MPKEFYINRGGEAIIKSDVPGELETLSREMHAAGIPHGAGAVLTVQPSVIPEVEKLGFAKREARPEELAQPSTSSWAGLAT